MSTTIRSGALPALLTLVAGCHGAATSPPNSPPPPPPDCAAGEVTCGGSCFVPATADVSCASLDHSAWFPTQTGTVHAARCAECHAVQLPGGGYGPAPAFSAYSCVSCHAPFTASIGANVFHDDQGGLAAFHAGWGVSSFDATVAAAGSLSAACYNCHKNPFGVANHGPMDFPIGPTTRHAGLTCLSCHGDLARPGDLGTLQCAACHGAIPGFSSSHVATAGVEILRVTHGNGIFVELDLSSPNCLRCHADGQVDRVASHLVTASSFVQSTHRLAGCTTCHTAMRVDKPFGVDWTKQPGCVACH
jgi:hypothetical protein